MLYNSTSLCRIGKHMDSKITVEFMRSSRLRNTTMITQLHAFTTAGEPSNRGCPNALPPTFVQQGNLKNDQGDRRKCNHIVTQTAKGWE